VERRLMLIKGAFWMAMVWLFMPQGPQIAPALMGEAPVLTQSQQLREAVVRHLSDFRQEFRSSRNGQVIVAVKREGARMAALIPSP